ncbi:sialate O-acetylesterase [Bacteroidota bacterium]
MKNITKTVLALIFLFSAINISAQITLPSVISDNMVLQQNFDAPLWGWAHPGEKISIKGSWDNISKETSAEADGKWMLKLKTIEAGGPYFVTINKDTIHNVLLGEVWICSGQSNMQWELGQSENSVQEIEKADYPDIRLFYVARDNADEPSNDCYGNWVACNPENAKTFSAVAYYFGKELHNELNIPIGLIHVSWGGSSAQAWINYNVLQSTPEGRFYIKKYQKRISEMPPGINPRNNQSPSGLYNAMLHPLIPFSIRGAIWYQGESNTQEHYMYKSLQKTMINNWRDEWSQGNFPFLFVQLAPFKYQQEYIGAALRDEQRRALEIPNTGMAVTLDIGNPDDIHPVNKKDVGQRLSLWALANTYEKNELIYSGPLYKSMRKENNKIIIDFNHTGSGLMCDGEELTHFTIAGNDKTFHPAKAIIDINSVVVSSDLVKNPEAVRFAFKNSDEPNLFNKEGLPASTFRTDNWKIITETASVLCEFNKKTQEFLISIEIEDGNEAFYTIDGSDPNDNSTKYTKPFSLQDDATIKVKVFDNNEPSLLITENKIEKHKAVAKEVSYKEKYHERYTGGGDLGLVNGIFGSKNFRDGNWQAFHGNDLEIVIDLDDVTKVSSLKVNCMQVVNSWIIFPKQIEVYISDDDSNFTKVATVVNVIKAEENGELIHEFILPFKEAETKFIKVIAKNFGPLPEWHQSAGNDSWIFVDEIIVE